MQWLVRHGQYTACEELVPCRSRQKDRSCEAVSGKGQVRVRPFSHRLCLPQLSPQWSLGLAWSHRQESTSSSSPVQSQHMQGAGQSPRSLWHSKCPTRTSGWVHVCVQVCENRWEWKGMRQEQCSTRGGREHAQHTTVVMGATEVGQGNFLQEGGLDPSLESLPGGWERVPGRVSAACVN